MSTYQDNYFLFDNDMNALVGALNTSYVITGCSLSAGAGLQVSVNSGSVVVAGTIYQVSASNIDLTAADATNPRRDILVYTTGTGATKTDGTAAAASPVGQVGPNTSTPAPPNIPASSVLFGEVWVAANATSISDGSITDRRILAPAPNKGCSYIVYQNGNITYAQNGRTGVIDYHGRPPNIVINDSIANLSGSGGTIVLSDYFRITSSVICNVDNIRLTGVSGAGVQGSGTVVNTIHVGFSTSVVNVVIDNLIVDGTGSGTNGAGITFDNASRCRAINNVIRNYTASGEMGIKVGRVGGGTSTDHVISHNDIIDCLEGLATVNSGGNWNRNIWVNNTIRRGTNDVGSYGVVIQNGGGENIVANNIITQQSILAILVGASNRAIIASNQIVSNTGGTGAAGSTTGPGVIHLSNNQDGMVVNGNMIWNNGGGGVSVYQCRKVSITGNVFWNNSQVSNGSFSDVIIQGTNTAAGAAGDVLINGNVFSATGTNKVSYHVSEVGSPSNITNTVVKGNRMSGGVLGNTKLITTTYTLDDSTTERMGVGGRFWDGSAWSAFNAGNSTTWYVGFDSAVSSSEASVDTVIPYPKTTTGLGIVLSVNNVTGTSTVTLRNSGTATSLVIYPSSSTGLIGASGLVVLASGSSSDIELAVYGSSGTMTVEQIVVSF